MKPHLKASLLCFFSLLLAQTNFAQRVIYSQDSAATVLANLIALRPETVVKTISASLYLLNNNGSTVLADGTVAQYSDVFDTAVDWQDARKLNNINENFGLIRDGISLAIERRPFITSNDTLFFRLTNTTTRKYRIVIVADSMPGIVAFWKDNYLGTAVPVILGDTTTIDISIQTNIFASAAPNRFQMEFSIAEGGTVPVRFSSVHAYQLNDNVNIEWSVSDESNVDHYEIEKSADGKAFAKEAVIMATGNNNSFTHYSYNDINTFEGNMYYRIKAIDQNKEVLYSKVVTVKPGKRNEYISLNTAMAANGMIKLQMNNQSSGTYHIRLMTDYGAILTAKTFQHQQESSSETVSITKNLAKGIYMLELIRPDGDRQCFKIIN